MSYSRLATPLPGPTERPSQTRNGSGSGSFISRISFKATHPSRKGEITPERRKRLLISYVPDWALTIVLAAGFFLLDKVEGYRRVFSLEDTSLRHPYAVHERVPNLYLLLIAIVAPLCIMPIVNFITVRSWWDLHNSSLGLILGASLTGAFTQVVKITVGRPRPDIVDRCQPPSGATDPQFGLTDWTICTQTDNAIMRDGFRSFFSGHSSLSFAGLGFLSFYLAGKLHLFDSRGHAGKAWLALSPFMAAALVAISRSMDYRHHWQDILLGSCVGTMFSYFSYRQYYPALESPLSHQPYSPRIKREEEEMGTGGVLPLHHHTPYKSGNAYGNGGATHRRFESNVSYASTVDDLGQGNAYEMRGGFGGTVPRPRAGSLEEVWKGGSEDDHEGPSYGGYGSKESGYGAYAGPQTAVGVRSVPQAGPGPSSLGGGYSNTRGPATAPSVMGAGKSKELDTQSQMATYPPSTIPSEPSSAVGVDLQVPEPAGGGVYDDPFNTHSEMNVGSSKVDHDLT